MFNFIIDYTLTAGNAITPVICKRKSKLTLAAERDKKKRMERYSRLVGSKSESM